MLNAFVANVWVVLSQEAWASQGTPLDDLPEHTDLNSLLTALFFTPRAICTGF